MVWCVMLVGACMVLVQWCGGGWSSGSVVVVVEVETYQTSRNPFFLGGGKLLPKF